MHIRPRDRIFEFAWKVWHFTVTLTQDIPSFWTVNRDSRSKFTFTKVNLEIYMKVVCDLKILLQMKGDIIFQCRLNHVALAEEEQWHSPS